MVPIVAVPFAAVIHTTLSFAFAISSRAASFSIGVAAYLFALRARCVPHVPFGADQEGCRLLVPKPKPLEFRYLVPVGVKSGYD